MTSKFWYISIFTSKDELLCSELRNSRVRALNVGVSAEVGVVEDVEVVVAELEVGVVDSIIVF